MNIVALVLAGGEGTRLHPLTAEHAKPAVPFASGYRLVDFVLSNLVNSRISTIYLLAQYKPESLIRHVASAWAPWFGDGEGTIKVLLPRSNTLAGQFKGTADAVYQYLDLVQAHVVPDAVDPPGGVRRAHEEVDLVTVGEQAAREVRADEAGGTRDERAGQMKLL